MANLRTRVSRWRQRRRLSKLQHDPDVEAWLRDNIEFDLPLSGSFSEAERVDFSGWVAHKLGIQARDARALCDSMGMWEG